MNGLYSLKQLLLLLLLYAFQYNKITIKCLFLLSWLASLATLHLKHLPSLSNHLLHGNLFILLFIEELVN